MKISSTNNSITLDCDEIVKEIMNKYGSDPIMSTKYDSVKKSLEDRKILKKNIQHK